MLCFFSPNENDLDSILANATKHTVSELSFSAVKQHQFLILLSNHIGTFV